MDLVPCEPGRQAFIALSAAADLCLQVSGDQGGPTERGKGLGNSFLECQKEKDPTEDIGTSKLFGFNRKEFSVLGQDRAPKLQRQRVRLPIRRLRGPIA
jgi:hypothetical protein